MAFDQERLRIKRGTNEDLRLVAVTHKPGELNARQQGADARLRLKIAP